MGLTEFANQPEDGWFVIEDMVGGCPFCISGSEMGLDRWGYFEDDQGDGPSETLLICSFCNAQVEDE